MLNATPFLRLFAAYRAARLNHQKPVAVQTRQLLSLVRKAASTRFGRDHNFSNIAGVGDFQRNVPIRTYEQHWKEYWEGSFPKLNNRTWPGLIPFFAVSSGTSSGRTKYIPLSREMVRSNTIGGTDLLVHHVRNRPHSNLLGGRSFMLGGSTDLVEQASGIFSGDLSGIAVKTLPWWARQRYFPPAELALLKNWEEKVDTLARRSLTEDIRLVSGVPSWMLIFFQKLWELDASAQGSLQKPYPNLEMVVHGGVNFAPYLKQFQGILAGTHAELREVYPASEGYLANADRGSGEGLRLVLDSGIFYEFVPLEELTKPNPTRHWIANIELGVNYAVVLSTCAGLWSYILGDTVRFIDREAPRVLITGRTSYYLSAFGEHLTAEEVDDSVSFAAQMINATIADYSVGPIYPQQPGELGGHLFVVEFQGSAPSTADVEIFAAHLDKRLSELNEDYEAHRASGFGLNPPRIKLMPSGTFAAWMKKRGKLGGQHKVPRIIMDEELFRSLYAPALPL